MAQPFLELLKHVSIWIEISDIKKNLHLEAAGSQRKQTFENMTKEAADNISNHLKMPKAITDDFECLLNQ